MPRKEKATIHVSLGKHPRDRVERWRAAAVAAERSLLRWAAVHLDAAAREAEERETP